MTRCSDKRLNRLVRQALLALEDPVTGFVFDDFDLRYRERERIRDQKSAAWYYRDKLSFEARYETDCAKNDGNEPAWVSDGNRGERALQAMVEETVDGEAEEALWLVLWRRKRRELSPKRRAVLDALAIDWRTAPAAKLAGVSRPTVNECKKIFKTHFAQCWRAYERDFAI